MGNYGAIISITAWPDGDTIERAIRWYGRDVGAGPFPLAVFRRHEPESVVYSGVAQSDAAGLIVVRIPLAELRTIGDSFYRYRIDLPDDGEIRGRLYVVTRADQLGPALAGDGQW